LRRGARDLSAKLPLCRVVLFGSYASGRFTAASDVDVLVVYSGEPRDDSFQTVRGMLDLHGLEPHIYTEDEAREMEDTLSRMTAGGVSIFERDDPVEIPQLPE
jgi:predicted nucleotidyltransferase